MEDPRRMTWGLALTLVALCGCSRLTGYGRSGWPPPTARGSGEGVPADTVIRGIVTAVDPDEGIVVLDVGKRQGVKRDTAFLVHRQGRYVGTVIADALFDNLASARYSRDMRTDPRAGDRVTSQVVGRQ